MVNTVTEYGITSRAVKRGLLKVNTWNPRDYTSDNHRTVDDRPYGGGPGMVMMFTISGNKVITSICNIQADQHR